MNLRSIGPSWQELWELHDHVERAFRDLTAPAEASPTWRPPTDVLEDEEAYWIRFDLPGVKAEEISLEVAGGSVGLGGEKPASAAQERVLRSERRYGKFGASVPLPRDAAPEEISARLEAGVLTVKVPRRREAARRKVEIETG